MDAINESNLVRLAQAGDRESYGQLADMHGGSVLAIAYSRLGDFAASQDIAQDALLVGFEKLDHLRRPQDFGAWLRTIARNLCQRWHRNQAYRDRLSQDCATVRARLGYDAPAAPSDAVASRETSQVIEDALQGLPLKEREALLLYYFEGRSTKEAASSADISPTAMRKRLQRARDRLRDVLNAQVEAGLLDVAQRRRMSACVAAAMPTGASYSKVAPTAGVLPSAISLLIRGLTAFFGGSGIAKVATGLAAAMVVAGVVVAVQGSRPDDAASPMLSPDTGSAVSTASPKTPVAPTPTRPALDGSGISGSVTAAPGTAGGTLLAAADAKDDVPSPSASGIVRDPNGVPVAGARIEAMPLRGCGTRSNSPRTVLAVATTANDGSYAMGPLPVDQKVFLFIVHPDWAKAGVWIEPLAAGEHREDVDVSLWEPTTVSGTVLDEAGNPIPGATVTLRRATHPDAYGSSKRSPDVPASIAPGGPAGYAQTDTGTDGRFTLVQLPKGWILSVLSAQKEGYGLNYFFSQESAERGALERATGRGSNLHGWDIAPHSSAEITIALSPAGALTGRVLLDGSREPVAGARVALEGSIRAPHPGRGSVGFEREAQADAAGVFHFTDLPGVDVNIQAEKDDLISLTQRVAVRAGETTRVDDVMVSPGGAIEGVVFSAETGQPMPGFDVRYGQVGLHWGSIPRTRTDRRGRYRAERVPAGEWGAGPLGTANWDLSRTHHQIERHAEEIPVTVLSDKTTRNVDLYCLAEQHEAEGALKGTVFGPNGRPVAGVEVRVGSIRKAITDNRGAYEIVRIDAGNCSVFAVDPETRAYGVAKVKVPAEGQARADIRLEGVAASISGRIVDDKGQVIEPRLKVSILAYDLPPFPDVRCDEEGYYTTGPVPAGRYRIDLHYRPEGYQLTPSHREVTVGEGEDVTADFVFTRMTGHVAGTAVYADGKPAVGVEVTVSNGVGYVRGTTDNEGRFRLEPIDGERLQVKVGKMQSGRSYAWLEDVAVNTDDLHVVLHEPGLLKGTVADTDDNTMPWVQATTEGFRTSRPVDDGIFNLWLPPGTYEIILSESDRLRTFPDVVIASGMETDLGVVDLDAGTGAIVGNATFTGGRMPEEGSLIRVEARTSSSGSAHMARPPAVVQDGRYRLDGLDPGQYQVILRVMTAGGVRISQATADVGESGETRLDFTVTLGDASVEGTVALPPPSAGNPIPVVLVFEPGTCPLQAGMRDSDAKSWEGFIAMATVLPDGSFNVGSLPAGTHDVAATQQEQNGVYEHLDIQRVTLAEGQQVALHLDLSE